MLYVAPQEVQVTLDFREATVMLFIVNIAGSYKASVLFPVVCHDFTETLCHRKSKYISLRSHEDEIRQNMKAFTPIVMLHW
jgi:hypothetical protein